MSCVPLTLCVAVILGVYQPLVQADGDSSRNHGRVLVLGAGMSGISAAKALHDKGFTDLLIIEGSDRIGGRLKEAKLGDFTVELGGTWIYGNGTNDAFTLAEKYRLSKIRTERDWVLRNEDGQDISEHAQAPYAKFQSALAATVKKAALTRAEDRPDFSARSALSQAGWIPGSAVDDAIEYVFYDLSYACPPEEISSKYETDLYDVQYTVNDERGFSQIVRGLADEFLEENDSRLHLNEVVSAIETTDGVVTVRTDRDNYTCDYVVVTFSVGVLQHRQVHFSPELPEWKLDAIDQFQMVHMLHIHLQFPTKFWNDNRFLIHTSDRRGYFTVWRNVDAILPGSNILHAILTGVEADRASRMKQTDIVSEAVMVLRKMYDSQTRTVPGPIAYLIYDWLNDPLFRGSYSNWPPGYTMDTYKGLIAPVGPVYFAGEYGDLEHVDYGYVHTAFTSGVKTAEDIAACNQDVRACENHVPLYASRGCRYSDADNYDNAAREDDGTCSFIDCNTSHAPYMGSGYVSLGLTVALSTTLLTGISFL